MEKTNGTHQKKIEVKPKLAKCGIVMPISAIENCTPEHWSEVLSILRDVINGAGFQPNLVSDADDSGIIQKRIIQNLYNNDVIVCDVSCKNPNVMFELGIRLAFDKPTIIIKDDKTDYNFDTSIIEHLVYPRDLRFNKIISFKENLKKKIQATHEKAKKDPNYSTFLKNFGEYKVAHLTEKEISADKYILSALEDIKKEMQVIKTAQVIRLDDRVYSRPGKEERKKFLEQVIEDFVQAKKLKYKYDIRANGLESDLYTYIVRTKRIQEFFDNPSEVKETMDFILEELPF